MASLAWVSNALTTDAGKQLEIEYLHQYFPVSEAAASVGRVHSYQAELEGVQSLVAVAAGRVGSMISESLCGFNPVCHRRAI